MQSTYTQHSGQCNFSLDNNWTNKMNCYRRSLHARCTSGWFHSILFWAMPNACYSSFWLDRNSKSLSSDTNATATTTTTPPPRNISNRRATTTAKWMVDSTHAVQSMFEIFGLGDFCINIVQLLQSIAWKNWFFFHWLYLLYTQTLYVVYSNPCHIPPSIPHHKMLVVWLRLWSFVFGFSVFFLFILAMTKLWS